MSVDREHARRQVDFEAFARQVADGSVVTLAELESTTSLPKRPVTRRVRDRIRGAVLGAAIGDALGHPTEFVGSFAELRRKFGPRGVEGYTLYWERDGERFAPYTDDTQMAEIVLDTVLQAVRLGASLDVTMERLGQGFFRWSEDPQGGHRAPGNACMAGSAHAGSGVRWQEAGAPDAGGSGSVMRCFPLGIVFRHDLVEAERWAVAQSRITHNAPLALAACAAMAVGTALSLALLDPTTTVNAMIAAAERYDRGTAAMMRQAFGEAHDPGNSMERTLERLQGWAAHEAIAAACYVFLRHPDDPRAGLLEAANTPGDSDTIATLVGALCGARCGVGRLPAEWVGELERSEWLRVLADEAAECVPGPEVGRIR